MSQPPYYDYQADDRPRKPRDLETQKPTRAEGRKAVLAEADPSLQALLTMWAERDLRYSRDLDPAEVAAIRAFREEEAGNLPPYQRARAWALARTWKPA